VPSLDFSHSSAAADNILTGTDMGRFKGAKGVMPPPEHGPNKFKERPSGASRMKENLSATPSLEELTALPETPVACEEGLAAFSLRTPTLLSALWVSPLTQNMRLCPFQHDDPGPPMGIARRAVGLRQLSFLLWV